ncbi:MAG: TlpA disulfide reductase family protein [Bacteroides sp.]
MKKSIFIIFLLFLCLTSCKNSNNRFVLKGEIANLKNDTILVYGLEGIGDKIDTIFAKNGAFSYSSQVDTIAPIILRFGNEGECLVYADKGVEVSIKGNANALESLQVSGGNANEELNHFRQSVLPLVKAKKPLTANADSFIRNHPFSPVSIYLLDKYFVQQENPNFKKIQALIKTMSGELRDNPYMQQMEEMANKQSNITIGSLAPAFSGKNAKGEYLSHASFDKQYVLLDFWASWCTPRSEKNYALSTIYKKFKKKNLKMIGVSLDTERKKWLDTIKKDTLSWEQITDFNGWDNSIVQSFGIEEVPTTILISPERTIIAKNLKGKELIDKLDELLKDNTTVQQRTHK